MRIPIKIGGSTLVGVNMYKPVYDKNGRWLRNVIDHDKFPLNHGNCFDLIDLKGKYHRVVNFCCENLEEWIRRTKQKDIDVECISKSDSIWIIVDKRIPDEWYTKNWCTVCTPLRMLPTEQRKEHLKRMSSIRKFKYDDGSTGIIYSTKTRPMSEEERKSTQERLAKFKFEEDQDIESYHSVGVEGKLKKMLGKLIMEEGFVYAPYIPKVKKLSKRVSTSYSKKVVNPDSYAKVRIVGEPSSGSKE